MTTAAKVKSTELTQTGLYIVGTPIGNLADISQRALEVLSKADIVCAEDTRVTQQLLSRYGIQNQIISVREHNESKMAEKICEWLAEGKMIAQVSDAGMPAICDPGYRLVHIVRTHGYKVYSVPGPSAVITALSIVGIDASEFYFGGFFPVKSGEKQAILENIAKISYPAVFYETPHRIVATLESVNKCLPTTQVFLVRELTKLFETVLSGSAAELLAIINQDFHQQKGEMVLIFAKTAMQTPELDPNILVLAEEMIPFMPIKKIIQLISAITPANKNKLYDYLLTKKK